MEFVSAWKAVSVAITGAFGILALVKEPKDKTTGKLTKWGRISLMGILISTILGVSAQIKESLDDSKKALELAGKADRTLTEIERTLSTLDDPHVSAEMDVRCDVDADVDKYCRSLQGYKSLPFLSVEHEFGEWPLGKPFGKSYVLRMSAAFFAKPINDKNYDDVTRRSGDWSLDVSVSPYSRNGALGAIPTHEGVSLMYSDYVVQPRDVYSRGLLRSVHDVPGTTMIVSIYGETDRYVNLTGFVIQFKSGQVVGARGRKFTRTKTLAGYPAYSYTFPKEETSQPPK